MKRKHIVLLAMVAFALLARMSTPAAAASRTGDPSLFQESYDFEAIGRMEEALASLDKLSEAKHDSYVALLRRGWLLYRLGRNAPSIEAYEKAVALDPKAIEARLGLLLPLLAKRRWPGAEKTAREVLQADPANYTATLRLAFAQYNLGRYSEARTLYQKLADTYPSDVEVRSGLGWAQLKLGRKADAASTFRAVLEIAPENALAVQGLAAAK